MITNANGTDLFYVIYSSWCASKGNGEDGIEGEGGKGGDRGRAGGKGEVGREGGNRGREGRMHGSTYCMQLK